MGESVSDFLHYIVSLILFISAISMLLLFIDALKTYNRNQIISQKTKVSVYMNDTDSNKADFDYVSGSDVFYEVIESVGILIEIDDVLLSDNYLLNLRQDVPFYINDLKGRLDFDADYIKYLDFDEDNNLLKVNYKKV